MDLLSLIFDNDMKLKAMDGFEGYTEACDEIDKLFDLDNKIGRQMKSQYTLYPYMFLEDFSGIDDEKIKLLETAGVLYYSYIIDIDRLVDRQKQTNNYELLYRNYESQAAIKILVKLFGYDSRFWSYFNRYNKEFIDSVILEREHAGSIKRYKENEFERIARGKSAIAKIAVAGLGCLSGDYGKIALLETTQDFFADSFQLYDDLKDWKEDFNNGNYSWLLSEILCNIGPKEAYTEEEILEELFASRYDEAILDEALRACDRSMLTAGRSKPWIKSSKLHYTRMLKLREDFSAIRKENGRGYSYANDHKSKVDISGLNSTFILINQKVQENIVRQANKDFVEMKHWLGFPREHGFSCVEENQEGVIFQHAFIVNLLREMHSMNVRVDSKLIDIDLDYWIKMKHKYFQLAWGYFPELPELSPDIDTYSEVLRAIHGTGLTDDKLKAELEYIFNNNLKSDGSFDTWIIDKGLNDENTKKSLHAAVRLWGTDPDPEVIANFIYTLLVIDGNKYSQLIITSLDWLFSKQSEEGYWESTWYVGRFYGSYVCARLLDKLGIDNSNTRRLLDYLLHSQNSNGSWGELDGNPQDTALAMSGILYLSNLIGIDDLQARMLNAVNYLVRTFDFELGTWYSCDFIIMETGRASGKELAVLKYRSVILTAAISLFGLCKGIKYINDKER